MKGRSDILNCIIVDDEYPGRQELAYFINNFSSIKILEEFDNAIAALEFIKTSTPDIIFLDISMPRLDGIAFGKILKTLDIKPLIVFVTAYREHAVEAFEIEAFDYILKPFSEGRIVNTLKKLEELQSSRVFNDKITLWKSEKMVVVNVKDICYCEAHEREVHIYTEYDKFILVSSISDFHKKLPQKNFFRCHRSYVVNLDKISEIIPWFNNTFMLKLKGIKPNIPVSRNNISDFKNLMGI